MASMGPGPAAVEMSATQGASHITVHGTAADPIMAAASAPPAFAKVDEIESQSNKEANTGSCLLDSFAHGCVFHLTSCSPGSCVLCRFVSVCRSHPSSQRSQSVRDCGARQQQGFQRNGMRRHTLLHDRMLRVGRILLRSCVPHGRRPN